MAPQLGPRLTISQAASYAGVTVRAIRHYHRVGLLEEPPRDESGYRRYAARDVLDLIRIRALAQAGVPLSRVGELLLAGPDELAAAVAEIDEQLRAEIRRLQAHRVAIAQLDRIDGLALPPEVVDYLDMLRDLGLSEQMVAIERDAWVIISAQLPDMVPVWIEHKRATFETPEVLHLYRSLDAVLDLSPGDPQLEVLADELDALFTRAVAEGHGQPPDADVDPTVVGMLDAESFGRSPGWRHLVELLERRGWFGWNDVGMPQKRNP
jgi:DNA-binding transcriptional MerR regulator